VEEAAIVTQNRARPPERKLRGPQPDHLRERRADLVVESTDDPDELRAHLSQRPARG
jgi:hypothetical protein